MKFDFIRIVTCGTGWSVRCLSKDRDACSNWPFRRIRRLVTPTQLVSPSLLGAGPADVDQIAAQWGVALKATYSAPLLTCWETFCKPDRWRYCYSSAVGHTNESENQLDWSSVSRQRMTRCIFICGFSRSCSVTLFTLSMACGGARAVSTVFNAPLTPYFTYFWHGIVDRRL